jgi:hypothetical protein
MEKEDRKVREERNNDQDCGRGEENIGVSAGWWVRELFSHMWCFHWRQRAPPCLGWKHHPGLKVFMMYRLADRKLLVSVGTTNRE